MFASELTNKNTKAPKTAWRNLFSLFLWGFLVVGCLRREVAAEVAILSLPDTNHKVAACRSGPSFDLSTCIMSAIEGKEPDKSLDIQIKPGDYILTKGILIFQRNNVTLEGAAPQGSGTERIFPTRIKLDPTFPLNKGTALLFFAIHAIDSSGITIRNLQLDGADISGISALGVCPTGDNHVHDLVFEDVKARGFRDFFAIFGQTKSHEHLYGKAYEHLYGKAQNGDPILTRLFTYLGDNENQDNINQYCSGYIKNILFQNNILYLKSVGFYLTPLTVHQSRQYTKLAPPYLLTESGKKKDWLDVVREATSQSGNMTVSNNQFIVDIKPEQFKSDSDYKKQLEGYFHSMLKVQGVTGLTIKDNIFDSSRNPDMFQNGASINLAANLSQIEVVRNKILFPDSSPYKTQGIVLEDGFIAHKWFGAGRISGGSNSTTAGLFGPVLGVRIANNTLVNNQIFLSNCCSDLAFTGMQTEAFCRDLDQHQTPGDPKRDDISIVGNSFTMNGHPADAKTSVVRANEHFYPNGVPAKMYCRTTLSVDMGRQ
jgi:hypothetical protein